MEIKVNSQLKLVDFGVGDNNLTMAEREVLHLLTHEFLTPKKIALRRGCSKQAVSRIMKKLKEKGRINISNREVDKIRPTSQPLKDGGAKSKPTFPLENQIRLHGQEFNIKIIFKDHRYNKIQKKANTIRIDKNTIRLYKNSIEIYSGQDFIADDTQKATARSFEYWNRFFARLEHDLKIILTKPRAQNIRLVNQHYAEINNELAQECEKKADKLRIYTRDDGKLWFLIDNSFNLHEAETLHPETAQQDMADSIKPFFNDLRDNKPPTLSQIVLIIKEMANTNKETAAGLSSVVAFLKTQLPEKPQETPINCRPDYVH